MNTRATPTGSRDTRQADTGTPARRPGRPRLRPVAEERRLIISAARAVVAERGFAGASVEAIAKEAGVARPSVYEQFGSKDHLMRAVVDDAADVMSSVFVASFSGEPGEPWQELVRSSFTAVFRFVTEHAEAATVLVLAEHSGSLPIGSGFAVARRRVIAGLAEQAREVWRGLGSPVGHSAELIAEMLYGMAEPLFRRQLVEQTDPDAIIDLLTEFTTGGLLALWANDLRQLRALDGEPTRSRQ